MIVADKPLNLEVSEGIKSSGFRIKASKKAFEILSAGLYSDRVKAIIREISCNAADSHVAAGKASEPIKVHLPNNMEPFFSVRDNGVGLSPHQISTVYTTYFESDKTDTNEMTGCLGLGSKSPFSYTDQFTVETRFDGVEYIYNAHMDKDGLPAIALLGQHKTDKCNGVEVKFPVKSDDFYEFSKKAAETLRWFTIKPEVVGCGDFEFEKRAYMRQTDKYGLSKTRQYDSHVIMGNVAYPITANELRNMTELERKVLDWGCDLFVPIGALDITANREKVSYDAVSVAAVKACLVAAVEDVKKEVEAIITNAPTLWQARRALHDAQHSILGQVKNLVDVTWKGQKILSYINTTKSSTPPLCQSILMRNTKFKKSNTDVIHADGQPIIINDLPHGGYVRAINWLNKNNHHTCYLLSSSDGIAGVQQAFLDETGIAEVGLLTSTLPKPDRAVRVAVPRRAGAVKAKLNEYKEDCHSNLCADYWKAADVDLAAGGIYVEIAYFRYKKESEEGYPAKFTHPSDLRNLAEVLRQLGYEEKIYGIRPGDVKTLEKHEGWISLEAFIEAVLDENDDLVDGIQAMEEWNNLDNRQNTICFFENIAEFSDNSPFGKFLVKAKSASETTDNPKARAYVRLADLTSRVLPTNPNANYLSELREKVYDKYPLLEHLNWGYGSDKKKLRKAVVTYVKAIDTTVGV